MKLVVGLGNPGDEYRHTRHNVGFMVIDALAKQRVDGLKLFKPDTYMNNSGIAVKKIMTNYKLQMPNLYIIHDDLDIPLGKYKIQKGKGPKEHRGILSIEMALGSKDFWRVRIGVDNRHVARGTWHVGSGDEYVLSRFPKEERVVVDEVIGQVCARLKRIMDEGAGE